jgi:hypothetical protein
VAHRREHLTPGKRVTRRVHVGPGGRLHLYVSTLPGRPFIGQLDPCELLEGAFLRNELEPAKVPDDFEGGTSIAPSPSLQRALVTTREIQIALVELGYDPGVIDGISGPRTRAAVKAFQSDAGLVADGIVGPKTRSAMQKRLTA